MTDKMVWVDIETTGLDIIENEILEIGIVITDYELNILSKAHWLLNPYDSLEDAIANDIDNVVIEMHSKSGLFNDLRDDHFIKYNLYNSESANPLIKAITDVLIEQDALGLPMCGSSVSFDRRFLHDHLIEIESQFHYRNIDVSTLKNLYLIELERDKAKNPRMSDEDYPQWNGGEKKHRSISDCIDSINELKFYREHLFR